MKAFEYAAPSTLAEALRALRDARGEARPLAGGTDLIAQMKAGRRQPDLLLDTKRIAQCRRLAVDRAGLHIGAAVACSDIAEHPEVRERFPLLVQGCKLIGSVQIQNRASLGGNLCNAAPSADTAPPVICLGGKVRIAGPKGTREVPVEEFFTGPGKTVLAPDELLVEIAVPLPPAHSAGDYQRFTPRAEMDIAFAGVGAFLVMDPRTGRCTAARIALAAVAPTPVRATSAERALEGQRITASAIGEAAERAAESARPITDHRASAEYRRELVKALARRALSNCARTLGAVT